MCNDIDLIHSVGEIKQKNHYKKEILIKLKNPHTFL